LDGWHGGELTEIGVLKTPIVPALPTESQGTFLREKPSFLVVRPADELEEKRKFATEVKE